MASKKLLGLDAGITGTIGTADTGTMTGALTVDGAVVAAANLTADTATVTNDLTVGGDLNVTGDIVSGGTTNTVTTDDFIDLANGYVVNNVVKPGGFTVQTAAVATKTTVVCNSFTAAAVGTGTANSKTLTVASLPVATSTITMTNKNKAYVVTFTSGGGSDGVFNSAGAANIDILVATTPTAIATAVGGLFNSLPQYSWTTSGSDTAEITSGNLSQQLVLIFTTGGGGASNITSASSGTSNGQAAFVTLASNPFASNDLMSITAADDVGNVGLFIVSSVDGNDVFIKGNTSVNIEAQTPFAQNNFQASTTIGGTAVQPRIFVNAVSDGQDFKDAGGAALTVGLPIYAYSAAGLESEFTTNGSYKITGSAAASSGTTLQIAYDAGQTITTDGSGNITFNLDDTQNFVVDTQTATKGKLLVGGTNDLEAVTVDTDASVTITGGKDATDAADGISITSSRIGDVANAGLASQAAAMHIESAGGISVEAAKNVAIMGDEVATIARFTSFAPIGANGAISLVRANGTASAGTLVVDLIPITASTLGITSVDIEATDAGIKVITFDETVAVGASDSVFTADAAIVGVSGPPTVSQVAEAIAVLMNSIGSPSSPDLRATVSTDTVTIHSAKYNGSDGNITWSDSGTNNITATDVDSTNVPALFAQEAFNDGREVGEGFAPNVVGVNAASVEIALGTSSGYTIGGIVEIMAGANITAAEVGQPVYLATGVPDASGLSSAGMITGSNNAPTDTGTTIFKVGIAMETASQGAKAKVLLQPQFIAYNAG